MYISRKHKLNRHFHFKKRVKERYGIDINKSDRKAIQGILREYGTNNTILYLGDRGQGKIVAVHYKGQFFIVVYDRQHHQVITALTEDMLDDDQKRRLTNLKIRMNYMKASQLETLKCCVEYLNATNRTTDKKKRFKELYESGSIDKELWSMIYNFDVLFHITSEKVDKNFVETCGNSRFNEITELLKELSNGLTGNRALKEVSRFIKDNEEYRSLIYDVLDKDLHIGMSATTLNTIVPGLFKDFKVALAKPIKNEYIDEHWMIEHKLDGVRCICYINSEDDIKFYSRQGKDFTTLGTLKGEIKELVKAGKIPTGIVLDGEVCVVDENGNEDFKSVMKEIKRKDYTMLKPMYILFDTLPAKDFDAGFCLTPYKKRFATLKSYLGDDKHRCMRLVEAINYTIENFGKWQKDVFEKGWEGLILRNDVPYEGDRSSNMLKVKNFQDAEYVVKDVEMDGDATILVNGKAERVKCVKRLVIEHKGNKVGVGSGLKQEQRLDFYVHPEHIIGKTICVRYFEEITDENGLPSLRFPTLKYIYDGERDV